MKEKSLNSNNKGVCFYFGIINALKIKMLMLGE